MANSSSDNGGCASSIVSLLFIVVWCIAYLTGNLVEEDFAKQYLGMKGYTQVQTQGFGWFQCDVGEFFATRFKAINDADNWEYGTVCRGILKGTVVRNRLP